MIFKGIPTLPLLATLIAIFIQVFATAPALAAGEIFDEIFVLRGVERLDGTPDGADPYFFEVCIGGPDISGATLPTVQTPISANYSEGSEQSLVADDGEFCFSNNYASVAALIEDFPNGSYTVTATNGSQNATDSKLVSLSSADVGAYSDITAPTSGGTVSTNSPTTVSWDLVDIGGCNTGDPATCLDFIWVFVTVDELGLPDDEVYAELIMNPATTGTSIPGGTFQANTGYLVDVENRRGAIVNETTDTLEKNVTVYRGTADINLTSVTGAGEAVPMLGAGRIPLLLLTGAIGYWATLRRRLR
jgi:hypothetical protein